MPLTGTMPLTGITMPLATTVRGKGYRRQERERRIRILPRPLLQYFSKSLYYQNSFISFLSLLGNSGKLKANEANKLTVPVPKQKRSRKRRGDKRKNLVLRERSFVVCSNCSAQILPHRACPFCGYYKGRSVIAIKEKGAKKGKKK